MKHKWPENCDQIYICNTKTKLTVTEEDYLIDLLSSAEISNFITIKDEIQRSSYLQSHAFKRYILSNYLNISTSEIEFYTNNYGKPFLKEKSGKSNCYFNLSHTSGMIALITSSQKNTGIDIEKIVSRNDIDLLEEIILPAKGIEEQKSLQPEVRKINFYKYWVLKECYGKAIGLGFSIDPKYLKIVKKSENCFYIIDEVNLIKQHIIIMYLQLKDVAIAYTNYDQTTTKINIYSFYKHFNFID